MRCPLCHKDIEKFEGASEDLAWRKHLGYKECSAANVRVSTNAKARISILKTKRPPASEVILEEEDEEEDNQEPVGRIEERSQGQSQNDIENSLEKVPDLEASIKSKRTSH